MSRPPLPAGYVTERERGAWIVALPFALGAVRELVRVHGTLYAAAAAQPDAMAFRGRGAAYRIVIADAGVVVRHYRRGGAMAAVLGDRYLQLGATRPSRELEASAQARARGVPTPEVVCTVTYATTPFYRGDIATRWIPDSRDLAEAVLGPSRAGDVAREAAWRAAGALLRRAFDGGVEHADLNMRNILIAGGDSQALLLDLDRARVHDGPLPEPVRRRLLGRLHRSRRKLEAQLGNTTTDGELLAFEAGLAS